MSVKPTIARIWRGRVPRAKADDYARYNYEAGINFAPAQNVTARLTWFDNRVNDPVLNVTLNATTAQKQNIGQTRIRGVQTDVEYRIGSFWRVSGAYVYDQAKVTDGGVANAADQPASDKYYPTWLLPATPTDDVLRERMLRLSFRRLRSLLEVPCGTTLGGCAPIAAPTLLG